MSEGIWGNVLEGDRDAMENDELEGFELEFAAGDRSVKLGGEDGVLRIDSESQAGGLGRDAIQNEGLLNVNASGNVGEIDAKVGNSRCFDQFESSSSEGMKGVNLHLGLGDEPSSSSSTASMSSSVERKGCDRDLHNKRPKVQSFTLNGGSHFENEICYTSPIYKDGSTNNLPDSGNSINEEGNDSSTSQVWMDLTDDLLHTVFSFLDHCNNLCRAAGVCRRWREASKHEDLWRCLNFEGSCITLAQFDDMCQRYPNATAVNIYGTPSIHSLVMKAVSSLRNLEVLTLGKGQIGDIFFLALTDCHMLRSLTINDIMPGNGFQEIAIHHDRLRVLHVAKCPVLCVSIRCPQLDTLSWKCSGMPRVRLNCPSLRNLDIDSCHLLSDAAIPSGAMSCPLLESLDMSNCPCVTDEMLREISGTCGNLHILDASYCPNISLESVRLPMLTVLKLHSCEGITSASMTAIAYSSTLEVLELDNCGLLTSVSLELHRLKTIRLVRCRKFVDLNLRSNSLSAITVSNCPSLQRVNITSNILKKLVLQKQESLTTLALQCQCLQEVDLTECESLTNSICEVLSDGGGCPVLKSLVLDNCESLTKVGFRCSSLVSLSLAGCRAITSLELKCPYLEQISLDGCAHLERASLCPVGLRALNLGICPKLNVLDVDAQHMASLELKGCGVLSEASINCPLLTSLDASFCSRLKDDCLSATTASCTLIESLVLMSCPSVGSDGLFSLRWLPNLTYLDLSYTFLVDLQPVFESCLHLKVLKLQACKYLNNSSLEPLYKTGALPALCELDLSYGTLCQSALEELLACCTHLTHVSLNGCINMGDLDWGLVDNEILGMSIDHGSSDANKQPPRKLQYLNCVGCPSIRRVVIPPTAQCLYLSSLNLSLSANLKKVVVSCNLCFLNLSNCRSLETLKLNCPKLTRLFLQSCIIDEEAVESAISSCTLLKILDVSFCPKISAMSKGRLRAACPSLKRIFISSGRATGWAIARP